ncbi:MAG: hypothetical protein ACI4ES_03360 [Roseburia sp.]
MEQLKELKELKEQYEGVIALLKDLKHKIENGRIRFQDLGEELIYDILVDEYQEKALAQAFCAHYKEVAVMNRREAESSFIELMIQLMEIRKKAAEKEEQRLLESLKAKQEKIVPKFTMDEDGAKHLQLDTREIFLQENTALEKVEYKRLDIVIKYLAIEQYFGRNDYGFELYKKLQGARQKIMKGVENSYSETSLEVFRDLIQSVEKNGYQEDSEIVCDNRLFLMDGAHRMALALYFGIPKMKVKVIAKSVEILPFDLNYLRESGFTEEELSIVQRKAEELIYKNAVSISCILWPPVSQYFDQITGEIATGCKVKSWKDYTYSDETFARVVKGVYHVDDIADWKIDKKIQAMQQCAEKKVRVLELEILAPFFRLKDLNANSISTVGERLKSIVRERYRNLVDNYIYDIIIHTGDNYMQSEYMKKLFEQPFSMKEYLQEIQSKNYFLIKHDAPYMTKDFPESYPFSKDIDLIVEEADYEKLLEVTEKFLDKAVSGYEIRTIQKEKGILYRIELNGYLIVQLDIATGIERISQDFWREALECKEQEGIYYVPRTEDEICIRVNELIGNPKKVHHIAYLKKHKDKIVSDKIKDVLLCEEQDVNHILDTII